MYKTMNIKYYNDQAREAQAKKEQQEREDNYLLAQNILYYASKEILAKHGKR